MRRCWPTRRSWRLPRATWCLSPSRSTRLEPLVAAQEVGEMAYLVHDTVTQAGGGRRQWAAPAPRRSGPYDAARTRDATSTRRSDVAVAFLAPAARTRTLAKRWQPVAIRRTFTSGCESVGLRRAVDSLECFTTTYCRKVLPGAPGSVRSGTRSWTTATRRIR